MSQNIDYPMINPANLGTMRLNASKMTLSENLRSISRKGPASFLCHNEIKIKYKDKAIKETLPKAERTHGVGYFDSLNKFRSKQQLKALKPWSNFSFILLGKEQEIHRTTLTNPCNNLEKSKYQF